MTYPNSKTLFAACALLASGCASQPVTYELAPEAEVQRPTGRANVAIIEVLSNPPGAAFSINNSEAELTPSRIVVELTAIGTMAHDTKISVDYSRVVARTTEVATVTLKGGQFPPHKVILLRGGASRTE